MHRSHTVGMIFLVVFAPAFLLGADREPRTLDGAVVKGVLK